jgi:transcriptional regulator with PAS, ATPase and Fis domain
MAKSSPNQTRLTNAEFSPIYSLLKEGNFKQALGEIKELESSKRFDDFSAEAGELQYLHAFALDKRGRPKQALTKAKRSYEILRNTESNRKLAQVQQLMGRIYVKLGELKNAEIQFTDTASLYRRIKDQKGIAETYNELARVCFIRSEFGRAVEYIRDALELCRRSRDRQMTARLHGNLGTILSLEDRWEEAHENLLQSLRASETLNDQLNVCQTLLSLGNLCCLLRRFQSAEEYLGRAYRLISENEYLRELAIFHEYQGGLEQARGKLESAHQHFHEAIRIGEQIGPKGAIISQGCRLLAELQVEREELDEALISCERSLEASKGIGERLEEAAVYRTLGRIHGENGDPDRARCYFDQAIHMLEEVGAKFELSRTYVCMIRCSSFEFWEKMKFLGRAEDLASRLDTPYYVAKVHADFAQLFFQNDKQAAAQEFLGKAKGVFQKLKEKSDLEAILALEKKIDVGVTPLHTVYPGDSNGRSPVHMITQDKAVLGLLESVRQVKDVDINILLEGETGTGKDLLAKLIHYNSNRGNGKLVVVTCAAVPEGLFESELFGHKRGAFTGAVEDKKGLVDEATGGTLYLDEIAEVPLPIQVKLLRAIEEKEIVRVGDVKSKRVDFRVIAATNRDLDELLKEGKFRDDLFYRLNGIRFRLPPLRERRDDIPLLVEHFLRKYCINGVGQNGASQARRQSKIPSLDSRVVELLLRYDWPGNVRELENDVKRMFIACNGEEEITENMLEGILDKFLNGDDSEPESLLKERDRYEKERIEKALAEANGVKAQAARLLGINEALLRYKIKKFKIACP